MNTIYECVESFCTLLDTEYHMILGRKGVAVSIEVEFDKKDCFHLMGLQYLRDRPELNRDRGKIFDEIRSRRITLEQLESSVFYNQIAERIDMLPYLERMFDSNDTIFKYNQKNNIYSLIQADYLMRNRFQGSNIYIFLSENSEGKYFCRSFFPETLKDYTKNQASWKLLYKEKIRKSTGESIVLYNKKKEEHHSH
ncbi:MAG: hypothetical protein IJ024_06230 [Lachnospiraceae bacterium]|nr:hypothetical protein [Lachnospiraceae bacterium]